MKASNGADASGATDDDPSSTSWVSLLGAGAAPATDSLVSSSVSAVASLPHSAAL